MQSKRQRKHSFDVLMVYQSKWYEWITCWQWQAITSFHHSSQCRGMGGGGVTEFPINDMETPFFHSWQHYPLFWKLRPVGDWFYFCALGFFQGFSGKMERIHWILEVNMKAQRISDSIQLIWKTSHSNGKRPWDFSTRSLWLQIRS